MIVPLKLDEGNLGLAITPRSEDPLFFIIGENSNDEKYSVSTIQYRLLKPLTVEGILVPRINVEASGPWKPWSRTKNFFHGKENILNYLESTSLNPHMKWISEMSKPYKLPPFSNVSYVIG